MIQAPPSMPDRDGKTWMDGQLVEWRNSKIHVLSQTQHFGCGAFEGLRAELGAGSRGLITEKVQSAFCDIVYGSNPRYAH